MPESKTVISALFRTANRLALRPCAHSRDTSGKWSHIDWNELVLRIKTCSAILLKLGIKKGDRVAIYGRTRLEWVVADFAIMSIGAVSVPIYHSFRSDRISSIIKEAKLAAAIVEDEKLSSEFKAAMGMLFWQDMPVVEMVGDSKYSIKELALKVSKEDIIALPAPEAILSEDDIATIVFTSGTTGELKGVVLSHKNVFAEVRAVEQVFKFNEDQIGLLWLPLAHVLGRMMEMFTFVHGTQSAFEPDISRLPLTYLEVKPHFVCGVPRMLEKIYEQVCVYLEGCASFKRKLIGWALEKGMERSRQVQWRQPLGLLLRVEFALSYLLFFRKIRKGLGGRLKCFVCGGARLSEQIAKFFHASGIMVLEGYGLTETFAAVTVNRFDDFRFGTVGKPVSGVEAVIDESGEILLKGPMIFREYLNRPEETKEAFGGDGWLRTGDLGEFSRDGFLRITGRIKELIITAGGKNISPSMIETKMSGSPYINHFVVVGDGRRYLAALVTLNKSAVLAHLEQIGVQVDPAKPLSLQPEVISLISSHIDKMNCDLASFETVKRFAILDSDFSVESQELTPTMKIRREIVSKKNKELIDSLF